MQASRFRVWIGGVIGVITLVLCVLVWRAYGGQERRVVQGEYSPSSPGEHWFRSRHELMSAGLTLGTCAKRYQPVSKDSDILLACRVSGTAKQLDAWIASRKFGSGLRVVNELPQSLDLIEVGSPFPVYEITGDVSPEEHYAIGTMVAVDVSHTTAIVYERTYLVID